MARLTKLHLKGWKSIRDAEVEFRNLNVLVGGNGAGKSNLISFLELFSEIAESDLATYIAQQGGAESILHLGGSTTKEVVAILQMDSTGGKEEARLRLIPNPGDRLGSLYSTEAQWGLDKNGAEGVRKSDGHEFMGRVPLRSKDGTRVRVRNYHFHNTAHPGPLQKSSEVDDNRILRPKGDNLAAMLYLYREKYVHTYRQIRAAVRAVAPTFDDFDLRMKTMGGAEYVELRWRSRSSGNYSFGYHQTSDGLLRAIALFTVLLQPDADAPDLLVFDEPELGLHPAALSIFADLLKGAAETCPILIATQSAGLVDSFRPEDIITVKQRDGGSEFVRLAPDSLRVWLDEENGYTLGELWGMNAFGGGPY